MCVWFVYLGACRAWAARFKGAWLRHSQVEGARITTDSNRESPDVLLVFFDLLQRVAVM